MEKKKPNKTPRKRVTKAQQRVAIARDVLAQLKAGRLVGNSGSFIGTDLPYAPPQTQVQEVLKKVPRCDVCAVGSLFLCAVEKFDALKMEDLEAFLEAFGDSGVPVVERDVIPYLQRYFSEAQLRLIEIAFERGEGAYEPKSSREEKASHFGCHDGVTHDEDIKKIMRNIIKNDGTFVP